MRLIKVRSKIMQMLILDSHAYNNIEKVTTNAKFWIFQSMAVTLNKGHCPTYYGNIMIWKGTNMRMNIYVLINDKLITYRCMLIYSWLDAHDYFTIFLCLLPVGNAIIYSMFVVGCKTFNGSIWLHSSLIWLHPDSVHKRTKTITIFFRCAFLQTGYTKRYECIW